ncbi:M56 family metallopeptidase [Actinoallomurus sp. NPDC050550]|uniref:M56 family metallopeptidase n=1 Tax=Actinoallomurus sp. NPDC050550 TaxID=3154937 RepID=UPI00340E186D
MTAAVALLAYAATLLIAGPRLLKRADWVDRAPRLGLAMWQAATSSVLISLILGGLVLAVPAIRDAGGLTHVLDDCVRAMRDHYSGVSQPVGAIAGLLSSAGLVLWTGGHVVASLARAWWSKRAHLGALALVARPVSEAGVVVVEHAVPVAYCIPGRHSRIVLTTGALDRLDNAQLSAVLEHEKAHLRGRHDLARNIAVALARAFTRVRLFRDAGLEITRLIELIADDSAVRHHDRAVVAAALVSVAVGPVPAAALGAGGTALLGRVRRLLRPAQPLSRAARAINAMGIALLLALPMGLALNPAVVAIFERHCPVG